MSNSDSQDNSSAVPADQAAPPGVSTGSYFRLNEPSVIHQAFDQEVVAVHLNTGSYHTLPGIAGEVFLMLGPAGASASEIAAELATRYDASAEIIEADLERFFSQLQAQQMIVAIDTPPVSRAIASPIDPAKRATYSAPTLESFDDLEGLVLIDPVHEVGAAGWPNLASETIEQQDAEADRIPLMRCRLAGTNVIFERFEAETVAMDLGTGAYHSLTGVAEEIFLLLPSEPTTWEIRKALAANYSIEADILDHTLRDYLNQLVQVGLIGLETIAEETPERELHLSSAAAGKPYVRPTLETFAQPQFDGPMGDDSFSHERTLSETAEFEVKSAKPFEPYTRKHYSVRTGDLLFSSAGDETVIVDRDGGRYFRLNQPASDVFRLLATRPDIGAIVAALRARYAVREHDLRVAAMILLWNLRKLELVTLAAQESPEGRTQPPASPEPLLPFPGFDVAVHQDLNDLLRPFNPAPAVGPKSRPSEAKQLIGLMESYFEETAGSSEIIEATYAIADGSIAARVAGAAQSADLLKAFEHLRSPNDGVAPRSADLTISVWNNGIAQAGVFLQLLLSRLYENWSAICGPRGELVDFQCAGVTAIYHPGPDVLSLLDHEAGKAFYLLRDAAPLPFWELSSPFRHILHPWFSTRGLQYTHAGAVGGPNGGVLLAGKGGSGKSTASLLCAAAGMSYAGDDYCLTRPGDTRVFSLYNTAKLKGPEDLDRVPEMRGRSFNSDSFEKGGLGKATFDLSEIWPERVATDLPLRAILLPVVTGRVESRLESCSPAEALLALAPSTVAQLPHSGHADVDRLATLAAKLPAFRLHVGSDLSQVPDLIRGVVG
jgi:hypothetical protein